MLCAIDAVGFAVEFDPPFARRGFDAKLGFEGLQVARVVVEQLLGDAGVFKVEGFGGHGWRVSNLRLEVSNHNASAARSCPASSLSACGTTVVPARTGMKLVSPFQRGTMWICRCSAMPAPAHLPRLMPRLKPSGFITLVSAFWQRRVSFIKSDISSSVNPLKSGVCLYGTIIKCPPV